MLKQSLRRLCLRHKTSGWVSGGPAEGRRVSACLSDGAHCPCAARNAEFKISPLYGFFYLKKLMGVRNQIKQFSV
jgi:hypothetical protein